MQALRASKHPLGYSSADPALVGLESLAAVLAQRAAGGAEVSGRQGSIWLFSLGSELQREAEK